MKLLIALTAALASSAELDPKILRLIGDDAIAVYGADVERLRASPIVRFAEGRIPSFFEEVKPRAYIWVDYGNSSLAIVQTSVPLTGRRQANEGDEQGALIPLDSQTAISGDPDTVRAAIVRWHSTQPLGPAAAKLRQLSSNFDNWFLVQNPLRQLNRRGRGISFRSRDEIITRPGADLMKMIQEAKGGIRFGSINEFHVEATAVQSEDAQTLAGLARWLPGWLQVVAPMPGALAADAIEDFDARASGSVATLTFIISDAKLRDIIKKEEQSAEEYSSRLIP